MLGLGWACLDAALSGRTEHRPTSDYFPDSLVRRTSFIAGGELGWRVSALSTPRARPAPLKIVVVTGAPSWAEYWAPVMAALPADREMVVVDRPGYGASEPTECVPDIALQARALSPLLNSARGQKILLVGQSYGAAIASLMAAAQPRSVSGLVLLSSFLGERGPTARWLVDVGTRLRRVIPRDLRAAVMEVSRQPPQLPLMRQALARVRCPIRFVHGAADDFAPVGLARRFAAELVIRAPVSFETVPGGNHFLSDGPPHEVLARIESCLAPAAPGVPERIERWLAGLGARLRPPAAPQPLAGV